VPSARCPPTPTATIAPCIPDLFIAATAELAHLTVLHIDKQFERIAELTGQSIERRDVD
jgi:predicted nucleic acid-binding protein